MLQTALGLLVLSAAAGSSYQPASLESGSMGPVRVNARAAGVVHLELTVDARGSVADARVVQDVEPFTDELQDAVSEWKFNPARERGRRTESKVLVSGLFRPAMLQFPKPEVLESPDTPPSSAIPFPSSLAVPPYPPNAVGSACVLVEVELDATGATRSARIVGSTTGFDAPALSTAEDWTFRPATRDGQPVPSNAVLVFCFRQPVLSLGH